MVKAITLPAVDDVATERALGVLKDAIERLPVDSYVDLQVTLAVGTPSAVDHGLGREPTGYHVIRRSANAVVWDTAVTKYHLTLNASANVSLTVRVF